jgi:hypothetical protein
MQGQGRQGQGGVQGQGRQGSGAMQGQGMGGQAQQRMRLHANRQQRDQYRVCSQSMSRVRTRVRQMSQLAAGKTVYREQALQMRERLRNELQQMHQDQERLTSSLSEEQRTAQQTRLEQLSRTQKDLDAFSEALGFELDQASLDQDKIREQTKKMDRTTTELQKQQRALAADLGIED